MEETVLEDAERVSTCQVMVNATVYHTSIFRLVLNTKTERYFEWSSHPLTATEVIVMHTILFLLI